MSRPLRLVFALATAAFGAAATRPAHAVGDARPALRVAMGMGLSVDGDAPNPKPDRPLTGFFFAGGLGDRLWGAELRLFANGATQKQVSRIAGELTGVLRPLAVWAEGRPGYGYRVLRTLALDAGPSRERGSQGQFTKYRWGAVVGGHAELPIGPPSRVSELRLRLGARRLLAGSKPLGDHPLDDSAIEIYALLDMVF